MSDRSPRPRQPRQNSMQQPDSSPSSYIQQQHSTDSEREVGETFPTAPELDRDVIPDRPLPPLSYPLDHQWQQWAPTTTNAEYDPSFNHSYTSGVADNSSNINSTSSGISMSILAASNSAITAFSQSSLLFQEDSSILSPATDVFSQPSDTVQLSSGNPTTPAASSQSRSISTSDADKEKRRLALERNRKAATKSRVKKKKFIETLETQHLALQNQRSGLLNEVNRQLAERQRLDSLRAMHMNGGCSGIGKWVMNPGGQATLTPLNYNMMLALNTPVPAPSGGPLFSVNPMLLQQQATQQQAIQQHAIQEQAIQQQAIQQQQQAIQQQAIQQQAMGGYVDTVTDLTLELLLEEVKPRDNRADSLRRSPVEGASAMTGNLYDDIDNNNVVIFQDIDQ